MWSDRLWAVAAVAAMALLGLWIMGKTEWRDQRVLTPLKGQAAVEPFYAAARLVQAMGGQAQARTAFDTLPPTDAVLVLTASHWNLFAHRAETVQQWVQAGGRLLIPVKQVEDDEALSQWLGVRLQMDKDNEVAEHDGASTNTRPEPDSVDRDERHAPSDSQMDESSDSPSAAQAQQPWFDSRRCQTLQMQTAQDKASLRSYQACHFSDRAVLVRTAAQTAGPPWQWQLRSAHGALAVRMAVGQGFVTVVNTAEPFTWRNVLMADNARVFLQILAFAPGDVVWFVYAQEGEALPLLVWREGWPVVLVLALALGLMAWRGLLRFGPLMASAPPARRSLGEQIRGMAHFLLRHGGARTLWRAQWRALDELAARRVPAWGELSEVQRVRRLADVSGLSRSALTQARAVSMAASKREMAQAMAVLEQARRMLMGGHTEVSINEPNHERSTGHGG